jgi:hypothetical protein
MLQIQCEDDRSRAAAAAAKAVEAEQHKVRALYLSHAAPAFIFAFDE